MSTTITYKGSTLTTVDNETKKLDTAGTWLEDDITITDVSGGSEAISVVDTLDSHGGTIRTITAVDLTGDTVYPGALLTGYTAHDAYGNAISGTASSGITPSGTLSIVSNGTYDVASYASAFVSVSGGGDGIENKIIEKTISGTYENSDVVNIGSYAFYGCSLLVNVSFPQATKMGSSAFCGCSLLVNVSIPYVDVLNVCAFQSCSKLETVYNSAALRVLSSCFQGCYSLKSINLPLVSTLSGSAFAYCSSMSFASIGSCTSVASYAFRGCWNLSTVILNTGGRIGAGSLFPGAFIQCYKLLSLYMLHSAVQFLPNTNVFSSTPISNYTTSTGGVYGSIFVPSSLYNSYITATNWSVYSARFVSLTESQVQHVIDYGTHEM